MLLSKASPSIQSHQLPRYLVSSSRHAFWSHSGSTLRDSTILAQRTPLHVLECKSLLIARQDNGTVKVLNTASVGPQPISIVGAATPVSNSYAAGGAFQVSFPGQPATPCPGPNYIVQGEKYDCSALSIGPLVDWKQSTAQIMRLFKHRTGLPCTFLVVRETLGQHPCKLG